MIGLSPLSAGHRRRFQPTCVRPSTGSYPRFSLPTDSSPGFASAARDSSRPVKARFRFGSLSVNLAPRQRLAGSFYKRHAVTPLKGAPTARGRTVSGTVSLPSRGAFHLSLTVLVRYRSQGSTQAWMVVHPGSDRVSRARPYSGTASRRPVWVRVRGCHPLRPALPCRSAPQPDLRPGAAAPGCAALQPRRRNPCRVCPLDGLAIGPLSLAATRGVSRLISSPPGT